ncbi:MAG: aldehyde dehydrogenase family protein [Candidatus Hydrogenedentes bacterium]|nr:aldehyde dehydrogenase family protein [Candidatus Hydrogenedentota bacterium]
MSAVATASPAAAAPITKVNPRTGETLYTLAEPSEAMLAEVMQRAAAVYEQLKRTTIQERIAETLKLRDYLIAHQQDIAEAIVRENGKCITDALVGDVFTCVDLIDHYAKAAPKILADEKVSTPIMLMGKKSKIMYCPIGPVLVIAPWNYPLNTALTPALCAYLAGNPVVIKTSEWTPLKGVLDRILQESGVFKDAFQVVFGGRDTGRRLVALHPAKIFFTGSVRGGKEVLAQAAPHLIPVELELGGKDPMLVFADAHLDRAVHGAVWGALNNSGQGCTSVERCFVERAIYNVFLERLKTEFGRLSTTDTFSAPEDRGELQLGCITTPFQLEKIAGQVQAARVQGAEVWTAYPPRAAAPMVPPTIVTGASAGMDVQREETFGPVITVTPFDSEEEAIHLANDTEYGLSSSVWTGDLARAERVARAMEAGNVCINDVMISEGNSALPFGGVKQSGMGRYKSAVGLRNFCNIKSIIVDKGKKKKEAHWYPYTAEKYRLFQQVLSAMGQHGLSKWLRLIKAGLRLDKAAQRS